MDYGKIIDAECKLSCLFPALKDIDYYFDFDEDDNNKAKAYLNMNDVFVMAADNEEFMLIDIPLLIDLNCKFKVDGIIAWVAAQREMEPMKKYRNKEYEQAKKYLSKLT